jgi:hypothetical protein
MFMVLVPPVLFPNYLARACDPDMRLVCRRDDGKQQRRSEVEDGGHDTAGFPCNPYASVLLAFGPEEVEEESRSKDEGNEDSCKDVVGGCGDVVVVGDGKAVVAELLDMILAIDVVCLNLSAAGTSGKDLDEA